MSTLRHLGHHGATYRISSAACVEVAGEAREQRERFRARELTAREWNRWRTQMFEAAFGAALAAGEREAKQ